MAKLTDAMIDNTTEKIMEAQAEWLNGVLTKLINKGVAQKDIGVEYMPDNRIVVLVDGKQTASCSIMLQG